MERNFDGIDKALKDGCRLLMLSTSPFNKVRDVQLRSKGSLVISVGAPDLITAMNGASEMYLSGQTGYFKGNSGNSTPTDKVDAWVLAQQEVHGKYKDGTVCLEAISIHTDEAEASANGATFQEAYSSLDSSLRQRH